MRSLCARLALPLLLLALAGCYRSAGDAIEPTPNTGQQPAPTQERLPGTEEVDDLEGDNDVLSSLPAASEEPVASVIAITVIPPTPIPVGTQADAEVTEGGTPEFITPRPPIGPLASVQPSATPPGGALTATPSGLVTPTDPAVQSADGCTHTVQPGDNLYRIATDRGLTVAQVMAVNPDLVGNPPILQPGQVINIPGCGVDASAQTVDTSATAVTGPEVTIPGGQIYTVARGDTLLSIAIRFGVTVQQIVDANNLSDPDRLDIGQQLVIPPPSEE